MKIKYFNLPIGKIIPILDGKFSYDVNVHVSTDCIPLGVISVTIGHFRNLAKALQ
ncbi:hypothetical protein CfE428DRAFT_5948 [Chthoniobacter flavus Ellin428]|uniref:Uncharacterized protein n=1 Tax=Chthoniobacter flavus Ellin428 TaxID=497964 RepID=B4DAK7_9BACT|nr:hypothetical protein CfE428DRAFT_5948 [Chthoniobacter flavus Ellin428]TCO85217.1 hypothetical protein EV701_13216 [Chthoniobacter flavus]